MRVSLLALALLCTGVGAGCCASQAHSPSAWVEYVYEGYLKVYLDSGGGSRVEVRGPVGSWDKPIHHTVLIPCHPKEVEVLARTITVLVDAGLARPGRSPGIQDERLSDQKPTVIRCGTASGSRQVWLDAYDLDGNRVWSGIWDELRAVGHVELAEGIVEVAAAQMAEQDGDLNTVYEKYRSACLHAYRWSTTRFERTPGMIYDPVFPHWVNRPAPDVEGIPALRECWTNQLAGLVALQRCNDMTTVRFLHADTRVQRDERDNRRFVSDVRPQDIPGEVLKRLKDQPWMVPVR